MSDLASQHEWLKKQGFFTALGAVFTDPNLVTTLLGKLDVPPGKVASLGDTPPATYWVRFGELLRAGLLEDGLQRAVDAARDTFPGNDTFVQCSTHLPHRRSEVAAPPPPLDTRTAGFTITIVLPEDATDEEVLAAARLARMKIRKTASSAFLDFVNNGSREIRTFVQGVSAEELAEYERILTQELAARGATIRREEYRHRDYRMDPLYVQGPDGQRFAASEVQASTTVKDAARLVLEAYRETSWPQARDGQPRPAVVEVLSPDGTTRRVQPHETLHEAGVRPGDTLRVFPESTAGVDPVLREEAQVRARMEITAWFESRPDATLSVRPQHAPDEILLGFDAPGLGPPTEEGAPPSPVSHHEVLILLPKEFPVQAPEVWWQTPIFHPNIDPERGWVCLGELADRYRPGLDFGELANQLVDLACWRNYSLVEGFLCQAAVSWLLSDPGASGRIAGIGGRPLGPPAPERRVRGSLRRL